MTDRRDESDEREDLPELDELLSALLDDEVDPERADSLLDRVAREPELAERVAEFERVDEALRALPAPGVPADFAARMRARIAEQQELPELPTAASGAGLSNAGKGERRRPRAGTRPPRGRAGP